MSTEKLVEDLAKQIDRRTFLGKVGKMGVGIVGGLLGLMALPQTAAAAHPCCNLCVSPSTCGNNCRCRWCWTCQASDGSKYRCCECHSGKNCGRNCREVTCAEATAI
jgi:hypothetical protein